MSVVAIRRGIVGIDIERLRDNLDARAVARRVFSNMERATIAKEVPPSRTPFFDYWTLKEAYAKAIGQGVRIDFRKISVSSSTPLTVALQGMHDNADNWSFQLFGCSEYRLAVAAKRRAPGNIGLHLVEVGQRLRAAATAGCRSAENNGIFCMCKLMRDVRPGFWLQLLLAVAVVVSGARSASAHSLGEGYIFIDVTDTSLSGWVEVTPTDLDEALAIDSNGDGKVSDNELLTDLDRIRGLRLPADRDR